MRAHGGEVESLTAATQRGIGVRAWIGHQVGYAFGTDLSEAGIAAISTRAAEAARVADEDEFAGPAELPVRLMPGMEGKVAAEPLQLSDPSVSEWPTDRVADLTLAIERAALDADRRVAAIEQAVYADSTERVAIASSTGISRRVRALQLLRLRAGAGRGRRRPRDRPRLRPRPRPRRARLRGDRPRRRRAGDGDDRRRQARVALLPGRPRPDRRRQLRRPGRRRTRRRRRAARALAVRRAGWAPRSPARRSSSTTTGSTRRARPPRPSTARACPAAAPP